MPIAYVCKFLKVSRSGYYAWLSRPTPTNQALQILKKLYWQHHAKLGAPSLVHDMVESGFQISERTVGRMLQFLGLRSKVSRRFYAQKDKPQWQAAAPNLLNRAFSVDAPNKVWVTDITYIRTHQGWLYLCVVLDLYSRKIVGWHTSQNIDRHLVCQAFQCALKNRGNPKGVMVHSDQGSQYCSADFKLALLSSKAVQSMSRKANCWDNAVAESFFHTLKAHVVHDASFKTFKQAKECLFEYIEIYYNRIRRHSANGWLNPTQHEQNYFKALEGMAV